METLELTIILLFLSVCHVYSQVLPKVNQPTIATINQTEVLTTEIIQQLPTLLDTGLPIPSGLGKVIATIDAIRLRFIPPPNFINDNRYSSFLLEYKRSDDGTLTSWRNQDISKSANPNDVRILNLSSGVLYDIRIRTQGTNQQGEFIISNPSSTIFARTVPKGVSNLQVRRAGANSTDIIVFWTGVPVERFGNNYDRSVLTYYIEGLTESQKQQYPTQTRIHFPNRGLLANEPPKARFVLSDVIPGALYRYDVEAFSDGLDPTRSAKSTLSKKFGVLGPINVAKINSSETSFAIEWENPSQVLNITGYEIEWYRIGGLITNKTFLTTYSNQVIVDTLIPGSLYNIVITGLRSNSTFGKKTDGTLVYFRADPEKPRNLTVLSRSNTSLEIEFKLPTVGEYSEYSVSYQTNDRKTNLINLDSKFDVFPGSTRKVNLTALASGALYRITVTITSSGGIFQDSANNSNKIIARTVPRPPRSFTGTSDKGTIYLSWKVPLTLYSSATWSYHISYYENTNENRNETTKLCESRGQNLQRVSLRDLKSGTGYSITILTVAGQTCNPDQDSVDVTYSSEVDPILIYTQPDYPVIKLLKQITLNSYRFIWNPPDNFESFKNYICKIRLHNKENAIIKYLEYVLNKNETFLEVILSQGFEYIFTITTSVGNSNNIRESVVINGINSRTFKTWDPYDNQQLFPRLQWKFTTCGKTGRFGPSQVLCDGAYSGKTLQDLVVVSEGIQHWVAPIDGLYRIVAAGAGSKSPGGSGAVVSGLFHLSQGTAIRIAVGQRGEQRGPRIIAGGSGGTFLVSDYYLSLGFIDPDNKEAMLIGGGGGSAIRTLAESDIPNARLDNNGGDAFFVGPSLGQGGSDTFNLGSSGMKGEGSSGGAGFYGLTTPAAVVTAGSTSYPAVGFYPFLKNGISLNETQRQGILPLTGGRYELEDFTFSEGGFGGGGSGFSSSPGGGGGYSGGGGGSKGGYSGGGGSYILFTAGAKMGEVSNTEAGYLEISVVGLPENSPLSVKLYLVLSFVAGILITVLCGAGLFGVSRCTDQYLDEDEKTSLDVQKRSTPEQSSLTFYQTSPIDSLSVNNYQSDLFSYGENLYDGNSKTQPSKPNLKPKQRRWNDINAKSMAQDKVDSDTISTVSSVSSVGTAAVTDKQFEFDERTGKLRYVGKRISRINSSFTGFESTDAETAIGSREYSSSEEENEDWSIPSPPPSPPLHNTVPEELVSEEQKQEFRQKLSMFHEMARRSRETENRLTGPTFVPSTQL